MRTKTNAQRHIWLALLCGILLVDAAPAEAQREYEPLFDKFNFKLEGSWVELNTEIRIDSEVIGEGTKLSFEDDLDLDSSKTIPTLSFEWQIARRHKLGVRYQDVNRDSFSTALTEIQWGDETIPIDASVRLGFDITQTFIDYAFYPWVKERWAAGFGIGVRTMDIHASLAWREENEDLEGSSDVSGTGPLPYLYFEYRRLFTEKWRFIAGVGWLGVKIEDIDGSQWIGRAGIEYLAGRRWGFGAAVNLAAINVDWAGLDTEEGDSLVNGAIDMAVNDFSVFVRVRF